MKTIQRQRKFAIAWVFVFVLFQALGRPFHIWTGCTETSSRGGSSCCIIDSTFTAKTSYNGKSQSFNEQTRSHPHGPCCHSHKAEQSHQSHSDIEHGWSSVHSHSHECSVCQWFSTPSLTTIAFIAPDSLRISDPSDQEMIARVSFAVSKEQSPRGPPR